MKIQIIKKLSKNNNKIIIVSAATTASLMAHPAYAKLVNAENALNSLKEELLKIIPVAAAVILLCLAIGYAGRYIGRDTFVRWAIGVVIAGSASEIATLLFNQS
ncbi:VirB2 family type IV secretion system major pilin TrwL [Bartonella gliris]|uniref:VirB2 family type IV secretion system major pilin TrwL n=1 Tax=Bartonella gliris TaxID=3004109 RepID=UPI00295E45A5|nr:VirB2 family type IV secretion system major pilin TrwL [Bartonella gliris]